MPRPVLKLTAILIIGGTLQLGGAVLAHSQRPAFRAAVSRVEIDVIVTANSGFIDDLTAADFRVLEDGNPVEVLAVQRVGAVAQPDGTGPDARGRAAPGDEAAVGMPQAPAPPDGASPAPGAIVYLIDTTSLSANTKARFADAWGRMLEITSLSRAPRAAYYIDRTGRIVELAPLGASADLLTRAAGAIAALPITNERRADQLMDVVSDLPDPARPDTDPFGSPRALDQASRPAVAKMRVFEDEERRRALASFELLAAFCDALWALEGRTTLVWVSSGVRLMSAGPTVAVLAAFEDTAQRSAGGPRAEIVPGIRALRADLTSPDPAIAILHQRVFEAANSANVSIYGVDPTLLVEARMPAADLRMGSGGFRQGLSDPLVVGALDALGDSLRQTADATGGRAFVHATDLAEALREAEADGSRHYLITYAPPRPQPDGAFHEVRVEVDRPGVHVRPRRGYLHLSDEERERRLADAARMLPGLVANTAALAAAGEADRAAEADAAPLASDIVSGAAVAAAPDPEPPPTGLPSVPVGERSDEPGEAFVGEATLAALARSAERYRAAALSFACDETIVVSLFNGAGGFRRRESHELQYIYTFVEPPPDASPATFQRLRDYRTRRGEDPLSDREPQEVRLSSLDLPSVMVRAYSWAFLFQKGLQPHYRFALAGNERVLDREAQVISFEPIPPMVAGFNDWFGRAWVDAETRQVLRVEALQAGDHAELDAIERDRLKLVIPRDGRLIVRLEADFGVEEQGLRLPSKVTLTGEDFSMRAVTVELPGSVSSTLPEWEVTGRVAFRVEQVYDSYRFFNVQVR
jgi:VWFA-related protein